MQYLKKFNIKFYKTKQWRKKRKEILIRDNDECQLCKREGRVTTQATLRDRQQSLTVHHIKHYDEFPMLGLTDKNLITVCPACHNKLHPEKAFKKNKKENKIHEEKFE